MENFKYLKRHVRRWGRTLKELEQTRKLPPKKNSNKTIFEYKKGSKTTGAKKSKPKPTPTPRKINTSSLPAFPLSHPSKKKYTSMMPTNLLNPITSRHDPFTHNAVPQLHVHRDSLVFRFTPRIAAENARVG
jgi:hypothetical protein